jgi:hypothetical protein
MLLQHTQTWRKLHLLQQSSVVVSFFAAIVISFAFVIISFYSNETSAKISSGSRNLYSFRGAINSYAIYCGDPNSTVYGTKQQRCYEDTSRPLKMYGVVIPTKVVCEFPTAGHKPVQGAETLLATAINGWFCPPNVPLDGQSKTEYLWLNIIAVFAGTAFLTFSASMFIFYFINNKKNL